MKNRDHQPVNPKGSNLYRIGILLPLIAAFIVSTIDIGVAGLSRDNHRSASAARAANPHRPQSEIWIEVGREGQAHRIEGRVPAAARLYRLNKEMLVEKLNRAPKELSTEPAGSQAEIDLPMPGGDYSRFRIFESSIMEPALAARFPEIRSYRGQGVDDPTMTMRCDISPEGFQALVLSNDRAVLIHPANKQDASLYVSYSNQDIDATIGGFQCGVTESDSGSERLVQNPVPNILSGATLRTYRIAVAATWEYCDDQGGGTNAGTVAAINTWLNYVNAIYERELAIRLTLVNNTSILFTTERGFIAETDPFTNEGPDTTMLAEVDQVLHDDTLIGINDYDVGHVLGKGGSGIAGGIGIVCNDVLKAQGVSRRSGGSFFLSFFDIYLWTHELGHQFGAPHSFNATTGGICVSQRSGVSAYETGSGLTLMSYAMNCPPNNIMQGIDLRFHIGSLIQINSFITGGSGSCAVTSPTGNNPPIVNGGPNYTIPVNTPFTLTATGSDPDAGDVLTYTWEQYDAGGALYGNPPYTDAGDPPSTTRPIFRPFAPKPDPSRTFPSLTYILNNANDPPDTILGFQTAEELPRIGRTLNFRVTARDNRGGGGGVSDDLVTLTVHGGAGPFRVTSPNTTVSWIGGAEQTITWDVNNTSAAPVNSANVRILLSRDGGASFPFVLSDSTPNDGSETITVPNGILTTAARIKVEAAGNIFFDISDANLSIAPGDGCQAVSSFRPQAGIPGASVIITGVNFTGVNSVRFFNSAAAAFTVDSDTQITATVPAGAATGPITIGKPGCPDFQTANFISCPSPPVTLQIDDGSFESAEGQGAVGYMVYRVNRITPASYPATLSKVLIRFDSSQGLPVGTGITVVAGANIDGDVNINFTDFQTAGATINALGQFNSYEVPPVTINSGDFVVGFAILHDPSVTPGLRDTTVIQNRSYISSGGVAFSLFDDRNYAIRAEVFNNCSEVCFSPAIASHPGNQTVCAGSTAMFSVAVTGTGLSYQWRKNGTNIGGATSNSYSIASATISDAGSYDVVVTGSCGTVTSNAASLLVNAATAITAHPTTQTVCAGSSASFSVAATGTGLSYQWRKNGTNISGATSSNYSIASTTTGDAGSYDVVVTGTCGSLTSNAAMLTVNAATAINSHPATQAVCAGSSASFSVTAAGAGLNYQWRKNGSNITGATSSSYSIASTTAGDAGSYDVVVTGACGTATSNAATLTVNAATAITTQPVSQTKNAGEAVTFSVAATGANLTYQWRKNGTNITGATSSSYTKSSLVPGDAGSYDAVVTGSCGTATSNAATLTVNCPTITVSPPAVNTGTVGVAFNQSFTQTGGAAPVTFSLNSGALPAGLTINAGGSVAGMPSQAGVFTITVRAIDANMCTGVSAPYTLTINSPPTIASVAATRQQGSPGANSTVANVSDLEDAENTLQVRANGGTSATVNGVTVANLLVNAAGVVTADVTAACGATTAGFTLSVTDSAGASATAALTVTVNANTAPSLSYGSPQSVAVGGSLSVNPAAGPSDNGTITSIVVQSISPNIFTGTITVNSANGIVSISNAGPQGTYIVTIRATDNCGATTDALFLLNTGCAGITVGPASIPAGAVGSPYAQTFTQSGGVGALNWSVSGGALPGGLTLDAGTGNLSGTSNAQGVFNFTIRATDSNNCFGERGYTLVISGTGLAYYPLPSPVRLLDTRPGESGCFTPGAPLGSNAVRLQQATVACTGIPANAKAIVGNATVVNFISTGFNWITLYPSDAVQPNASNLNFSDNQIVPNNFTVGLGPDGAFNIYSRAATHFIVDVTGYYAPPGAGGLYYHPLPAPVRLFDSRPGESACDAPGAPLGNNATRAVTAHGTCLGATIPSSARSIVGNATVVNFISTGFNWITLYPFGTAQPNASNLNFTENQIVPNAFVAGLSNDGKFNIYSRAATHFIVDVAGYFSEEAIDVNGVGLLYTPLPTPVRLLDTRPGEAGCDAPGTPLGNAAIRTQSAHRTCFGVTIPSAAKAVVGNATVVNFISTGFHWITLFPFGSPQPNASNLNFTQNQIVPNAFVVGLSNDGKFDIYSNASTHFIVDLTGYFAP